MPKRKKTETKAIRVQFYAHEEAEPVSLWVYAGEAGVLTLQRDYPDFAPQAGWKVKIGDTLATIRSTDGRNVFVA